MRRSESRGRHESGVGTMLLVTLLGIFVIGAGSVFSFEVGRVNLAREQLRGCCDAASLAATAALISNSTQQPEDLGYRNKNATRIAKEIFSRNCVLAAHLEKSELTPDCDSVKSLKDKEALLSVHIENNHAFVKSVVSYQPALGKFFGIGSVPVRAYSKSGPSKLDVVVVMDISTSMTYETPCALISRHAEYKIGPTKMLQGPPITYVPSVSVVTEYKVLDRIDAEDSDDDEGGRRWSAFPPQHLMMDQGFSPALRNNNGNTGSPPGNVKKFGEVLIVWEPWKLPHAANTNRIFSDSVVLVDQSEVFPNIATMVEASRGNLDNQRRFHSSLADSSGRIPENLVGRATKAEYERQARMKLEPLSTALSDVKEFGERLRKRTDAHFAFIPFGPYAADSETGTIRQPIVGHYSPDDLGDHGMGTFPLRQVKLDKDNDKWEQVLREIERRGDNPLSQLIGTNTADALEQAFNMLTGEKSAKRSDARQLVVLISDGLPHAPRASTIRDNRDLIADIEHRSHREDIVSDTYGLARKLKQQGVTLVTIGFLHDKVAKHRQNGEAVLRHIAEEGGDANNFFLAQDKEQLQKALSNIERKLVSLE